MKNPGLVIASIIIFVSVSAVAEEVKVIANPSVRADSITVADLRSVFLEERRSLADGSHVEPVLASSGPAHETFLKLYIGKSDDALRNYYRTLIFTGTGFMPKTLGSDVEVLGYVARTKGAIGYVRADVPEDGAKILVVVQPGTSGERRLLSRIEPDYPETLKLRRIGGMVRLWVTISPKGSVENIQVVGGNPILAEAAIKAVRQWVYSPSSSRTASEVSIDFDPHR